MFINPKEQGYGKHRLSAITLPWQSGIPGAQNPRKDSTTSHAEVTRSEGF